MPPTPMSYLFKIQLTPSTWYGRSSAVMKGCLLATRFTFGKSAGTSDLPRMSEWSRSAQRQSFVRNGHRMGRAEDDACLGRAFLPAGTKGAKCSSSAR
eukprot:556575-Rhodomonas_salina.2